MGKAGRERNGAMTVAANKVATTGRHMGSPLEVLLVFLKLGVSCFGGPIAHIGYFREEFVVRRRWIDERAYVDLVALCQFLPGPASSQVGFSIGLLRGGYRGALAAWTGFTLPSAIVLVLFAYGAGALGGPIGTGLLHGLKLALLWQILGGAGFPNQFFCNSWVVGFWRGRPWLPERWIGGMSLGVGSSRFWLAWATRRGDRCVRSTCRV